MVITSNSSGFCLNIEIVAYDQLFDIGKHQVLDKVKAAVKGVRKNLQVGFISNM